jgi:hypothetical protein
MNPFYILDYDVLYEIIQKLYSLHTYLCLIRAFPLLQLIFKLNDFPIRKQILQELSNELPPDISLDTFIIKLRECDGFLAGSFILKQIYKHDWNHYDIDIFIPVTNSDEYSVLDSLFSDYRKNCDTSSYHSSAFIYCPILESKIKLNTPKNDDQAFDLNIKCVNNYWYDYIYNYQIIGITPDLYKFRKQFCNEVFDFDFCKISFDGYKIRIGDMNSIILKTSKIPPPKLDTESRIVKYTRRGFFII